MAAAPIATYQERPATSRTGYVDVGVADLDIFTGDDDRSAGCSLGVAGGRESARYFDCLCRHARWLRSPRCGPENDHTVVTADRVGFNHAGVSNDRVDDLPRRNSCQFHPAAVGL